MAHVFPDAFEFSAERQFPEFFGNFRTDFCRDLILIRRSRKRRQIMRSDFTAPAADLIDQFQSLFLILRRLCRKACDEINDRRDPVTETDIKSNSDIF